MWSNLHRALRVLRKDPVFTSVAIGSLAIGIGATAAMFSFADSMLLRPLPVRNPSRVVTINTAQSASYGINPPISYPDYLDLQDHTHSFDGLIAASYSPFGFSTRKGDQPHMKWGLYVSGNFFRVLGVEPALGRGFRPDEDVVEGRDAVVVLGHDFWAGQFGASPSVLGSHIRLNSIEFTIIGVAPEHFTGIDAFLRPQVFVPLSMSPRMGERNYLHDRDFGWLIIKGPLKPGVSLPQAQAEVTALSAGLEKLHSQSNRDWRLRVETELQFRVAQGPQQSQMVEMLALLGICVLMVACANVAGLLLSQARARAREIAVRLAIGASRSNLIRQLLFENLLLSLAGGAGGMLVADLMADFWRRMPIPTDVPVVWNIQVDHRVLLFTLLTSVASTLLFGLAPAWRASRPNLVPALKSADADSGGPRRLWGRNALVVCQLALSLVLLALSAAFVEGFREQFLPGPGYRVEGIFLSTLDTQLANYAPDQTPRFYKDLLDHTRAAPGVRSAALVWPVPMQDAGPIVAVVPEGWQLPPGKRPPSPLATYVSDGYFKTMNIPILRGRALLDTDRANTPLVAVVNEQMTHYWNGDALGRRFHLGEPDGPLVQIVGIARMSKYMWIAEPLTECVYLPYLQHPRSRMSMVTESVSGDAAALAPVLRDVLHNLDPDMPVFEARTMHDLYVKRAIKTSDILVQIVAGMGLIGLLLSAVGLYGLVAYSVSRRTREIGIRMALGANRGAVVWMVLRQGLRLGVVGVAIGLVAALYACRAMISGLSFFSFMRVDVMVYMGIPAVLLAVMVLACWGPARRAALVDPLTSLRDE